MFKVLSLAAALVVAAPSVAHAATTFIVDFSDTLEFDVVGNANLDDCHTYDTSGYCVRGAGIAPPAEIADITFDVAPYNDAEILEVAITFEGFGSLDNSGYYRDDLFIFRNDDDVLAQFGNVTSSLFGPVTWTVDLSGSGVALSDLTLNASVTGEDEVLSFLSVAFVATVPEPATWLMMLAGFAIAGQALRRRQVGAAAA